MLCYDEVSGVGGWGEKISQNLDCLASIEFWEKWFLRTGLDIRRNFHFNKCGFLCQIGKMLEHTKLLILNIPLRLKIWKSLVFLCHPVFLFTKATCAGYKHFYCLQSSNIVTQGETLGKGCSQMMKLFLWPSSLSLDELIYKLLYKIVMKVFMRWILQLDIHNWSILVSLANLLL